MNLIKKVTLVALCTFMTSQLITVFMPIKASDERIATADATINGQYDSNQIDNYIPIIEQSDMPDNVKIMLLDTIHNDLTPQQMKVKYGATLSASDLQVINETLEATSERGLAGIALKIILHFIKKYGLKMACAYFSIQGAHYILYNACRAARWW